MDGHPVKKNKKFRGHVYSDTRHAVASWLELELPQLSGTLIDLAAGNWPIPRQLVTPKITEFKTFDRPAYGTSKNNVDFTGDIQALPADWTNRWDNVLCLEALECFPNPFKAVTEMHRVLAPGGTLLLTSPYNYRFFGAGSWVPAKPNPIKDYWRITRDGLELLLESFAQVSITGHGGSGEHDRFGYLVKATK